MFYQLVHFNNQVFYIDNSNLLAASILYKRKSKKLLPSYNNLLVCSYITILVIEKAKMAKDIFNKKAFIAGTTVANISADVFFLFQFLYLEEPKQI